MSDMNAASRLAQVERNKSLVLDSRLASGVELHPDDDELPTQRDRTLSSNTNCAYVSCVTLQLTDRIILQFSCCIVVKRYSLAAPVPLGDQGDLPPWENLPPSCTMRRPKAKWLSASGSFAPRPLDPADNLSVAGLITV